jgi:hypothetical protein
VGRKHDGISNLSLNADPTEPAFARAPAINEAFGVKPSDVPDVKYARSRDVAIAYQVVGEGPIDIVFVRGITGELLSTWEQPLLVRHVEGLAACGRVLMLDVV